MAITYLRCGIFIEFLLLKTASAPRSGVKVHMLSANQRLSHKVCVQNWFHLSCSQLKINSSRSSLSYIFSLYTIKSVRQEFLQIYSQWTVNSLTPPNIKLITSMALVYRRNCTKIHTIYRIALFLFSLCYLSMDVKDFEKFTHADKKTNWDCTLLLDIILSNVLESEKKTMER